MRKNVILTLDEFINYIISHIKSHNEINIDFAEEFLPDASDGTGWYGVKYPVHIFDEAHGLFAIGYYGGYSTKTFEIDNDIFNENYFEEFLRFYFASHGIGNQIMVGMITE